MGVFCLTAPNMAARVRRVVMAIPVLPGMDSGGRNSESQDTITNRPVNRIIEKLGNIAMAMVER